MKALVEQIQHHRRIYYAGIPEISDKEYDALEDSLRKRDPNHPLLHRVGTDADASAKVVHNVPMLSLDKCYDDVTLGVWVKGVEKVLPGADVILMPKLDGFAVSLHYNPISKDQAVLDIGASRGNGRIGENVTENIRSVGGAQNAVFLSQPIPESGFEVRGEVVMLKQTFTDMKMAEQGYKSCRNIAASTICTEKDPRVVADRELHFLAYNVLGLDLPTLWDRLKFLESLNFNVVQHKLVQIQDVEEQWNIFKGVKEGLPYDVDGMVISVNSIAIANAMGCTSHHPRSAIAWKFDAEAVWTKLGRVVWQVSRTGRINPVAEFAAVDLDGATITRATLHNLSEMERLRLTNCSEIKIRRQGGVIPQVVDARLIPSVTAINTKIEYLSWPWTCPACGASTEVLGDEVIINGPYTDLPDHDDPDFSDALDCLEFSEDPTKIVYCTNKKCTGVMLYRIIHFCKCMDMTGIGDGIISKLQEAQLVNDIPDLFKLKKSDLMQLDKIGETSATNIMNAIWKGAESVTLAQLLWAVGIPHVGKVGAETLATNFPMMLATSFLTHDKLEKVEGFSKLTASDICNYWYDPKCEDLMNRLVYDGNAPYHHLAEFKIAEDKVGGPLSGKSFLITGTLGRGRKDVEAGIIAAGGSISSSVNKKLNYLVVGDNPGSKVAKASKYGTLQISEDELIKLMDG